MQYFTRIFLSKYVPCFDILDLFAKYLTKFQFHRAFWHTLSAAILLKSCFKQVGAYQQGISLGILYPNTDEYSLYMILLRTKLLLLGWGTRNFHCAFDQRALTMPSSLRIPFICEITLKKKKKKICSFKQTLFLTKKKTMTTVLQLCSDTLKQRRIDFSAVLCLQVLLHKLDNIVTGG